jgi:hypothetical protein
MYITGSDLVCSSSFHLWHCEYENVAGCCENGNELSVYIKCGELLD